MKILSKNHAKAPGISTVASIDQQLRRQNNFLLRNSDYAYDNKEA